MRMFRFHPTRYLEPERNTLRIARAQRLTTLLEQDRRFADLPNFADRLKALSPAPKIIDSALSKLDIKNGRVTVGHKAALIAAALSSFSEKDFGDQTKRTNYRTLRSLQFQTPTTRVAGGGRQKVSPTGGDKRRYNPTGKAFAATVYGGVAKLVTPHNSWVQVFRNPGSVIPCVQRSVRRQVLFAKGKGGKGYKVKHRKTWSSGVPC